MTGFVVALFTVALIAALIEAVIRVIK